MSVCIINIKVITENYLYCRNCTCVKILVTKYYKITTYHNIEWLTVKAFRVEFHKMQWLNGNIYSRIIGFKGRCEEFNNTSFVKTGWKSPLYLVKFDAKG